MKDSANHAGVNDGFALREPEPLLIVISGHSGAGKDAVILALKERKLDFSFVVTVTDRAPRSTEVHGKDYIFVSPERFQEMIANDELLEYAQVYDHHKGVAKDQIRAALDSGKDVVLRLDVQGAATIKRICPEAVMIFLRATSEAEMRSRLDKRNTETEEALRLRITTAYDEMQRIDEYDYEVINPQGRLDKAVDAILAIIQAEHLRVDQRKVHI